MSTNLSPGMVVSTKKWPRWWLHPRFWGMPKSGTVLSWSDPRVKALVGEKEYDKEVFIPVAWESGVIAIEPCRSLRAYKQVKKEWEKAYLEQNVNGYGLGAIVSALVAGHLYNITLILAYHGLLPSTANHWRLLAFIAVTTILSGVLSTRFSLPLLAAILVIGFVPTIPLIAFPIKYMIDYLSALFYYLIALF